MGWREQTRVWHVHSRRQGRGPRRSNRRRWVALAILGLTVGTVIGSGPASGQDAVPVRFIEDSPLALSSTPTQVAVVNESGNNQTVTLALTLFDAAGAGVELFTITPAAAELKPGETASFRIGAKGGVTMVAATGTLVSTATSTDAGTSPIRSTRPATAAAPAEAEPAVKQLTMVSEMSWFGNSPKSIAVYLPLKAGKSCPNPTASTTTTTAPVSTTTDPGPTTTTTATATTSTTVPVSDGSRVEELTYTCEDADEATGLPARLVFTAPWRGHTGTYTGTVTVGGTDVALTVRRTAGIWRALAALLLGLGLGLWWNVDSVRSQQIRRAKRRNDRLADKDAVDAQREFDKSGLGKGREYNFTAGVAAEATNLEHDLDDLKPKGLFKAFTPSVKADLDARLAKVVDKMATLSGVIQAWPGLAEDLVKLEVLHSALTNAPPAESVPPSDAAPGPKPPDPPLPWGLEPMAPILTARADRILHPTAHKDVTVIGYATAKDLETEVDSLLAAFGLLTRIKELTAAISARKPNNNLDAEDQAVWARARQLITQAAAELQGAATVDAVEKAGTADLVENARRLMLQLPPPAPPAGPKGQSEEFHKLGPDGSPPPVEATFAPLALARRLLWQVSTAVEQGRSADRFGVLLGLALAIWGGLALNYFDKAWGSLRDFIVMAVWAFAVSTVAPGLITALENLGAEPTMLDKKADDKTDE